MSAGLPVLRGAPLHSHLVGNHEVRDSFPFRRGRHHCLTFNSCRRATCRGQIFAWMQRKFKRFKGRKTKVVDRDVGVVPGEPRRRWRSVSSARLCVRPSMSLGVFRWAIVSRGCRLRLRPAGCPDWPGLKTILFSSFASCVLEAGIDKKIWTPIAFTQKTLCLAPPFWSTSRVPRLARLKNHVKSVLEKFCEAQRQCGGRRHFGAARGRTWRA